MGVGPLGVHEPLARITCQWTAPVALVEAPQLTQHPTKSPPRFQESHTGRGKGWGTPMQVVSIFVGSLGGRPLLHLFATHVRGNCVWHGGPIMLDTPLNAKLELKKKKSCFRTRLRHVSLWSDVVSAYVSLCLHTLCIPRSYPGHYFLPAVGRRQPHGFLEHLQRSSGCQRMCCGEAGPILWFNTGWWLGTYFFSIYWE